MKTSTIKFQDRKKNIGRIWGYFSRHFGKSFWILTMLCVSCTPLTPITLMLSITGMEAKSNLSFSPEMIDFGTRVLRHTSSAEKVTIRNDGSEPVLINQLSITAGFSIVASSCPMPPEALASQGTCMVELVFKPSLPSSWVGEFQVHYGQNQVMTIPLKGYAQIQELLAGPVR